MRATFFGFNTSLLIVVFSLYSRAATVFNRHILNCLVQNEPGVLSRVSGILAGRGFNIDSLVVCRTEIRDLSRMCIAISGQDSVVEQARRQLEDLVGVLSVSSHYSLTVYFYMCAMT